jgi:hypothetical protein
MVCKTQACVKTTSCNFRPYITMLSPKIKENCVLFFFFFFFTSIYKIIFSVMCFEQLSTLNPGIADDITFSFTSSSVRVGLEKKNFLRESEKKMENSHLL